MESFKSTNAYLALTGALALALALAMSTPVHATLIDDTVNCEGADNFVDLTVFSCNVPSAVVGPGIEFTMELDGTNQLMTVDLDVSTVALTALQGLILGVGETVVLTDLDWTNGPGGIIDIALSGNAPIGLGQISFGPDSLSIDIDSGLEWSNGNVANITLITQQVPEPATLALMGLGLAGIGYRFKQLKQECVQISHIRSKQVKHELTARRCSVYSFYSRTGSSSTLSDYPM